MQISQGRKERRALSPSHKLCIHPNGLDHQGWASSCGSLGPRGTGAVPVIRATSRDLIKRSRGVVARVAEG